MPERIIKNNEAVKEATDQMMEINPGIFVIGEGVTYKNGADGTTAGLKLKYPSRVFDVPLSEAGFTGMAVGSAITGLHPIVHHGRVEFALFAADSIFTQASKWNYMFGGNNPVPIVFRINIGRQWGNGPQHTRPIRFSVMLWVLRLLYHQPLVCLKVFLFRLLGIKILLLFWNLDGFLM
jgi:pyruvate dehydrogenase E1 component beta subunit